MLEQNKAVIRRFVAEVLNKNNRAALDELLAEDYVLRPPYPLRPRGRKGFERDLDMLRAAFPDVQFRLEGLVAEGDTVAARFTWRGTHRGEFENLAPTGKVVYVSGMAMYRIVDGKIAEGRGIADALGLMEQLGSVSVPDQSIR